MTAEDQIDALRREVEGLKALVSTLWERLAAGEPARPDPDAEDFGGGGEPDEDGRVGPTPPGFADDLPVAPPTDGECSDASPTDPTRRSLAVRAPTSALPEALQIHGFDDPLSSSSRVQLAAAKTTGTGGGTKLRLLDPDGNADFQTKWMVPLRRADTGNAREVVWACIGGEVDVSAATAEAEAEDAPGDYDPKQPEDYDPTDPDPIYVPVPDPDYDPDDPDHDKPYKYLRLDGFFWLQGGTAQTNYGTSLKLGQNNSYITISAS